MSGSLTHGHPLAPVFSSALLLETERQQPQLVPDALPPSISLTLSP